jgi:hypothetical protein
MSNEAHKVGKALELLERSLTRLESERPAWVDEILQRLDQIQTVAVETAKDLEQLRKHVMPELDEHGRTIRSLEEEAFIRIGGRLGSNGNGNGNAE